MPTCQECGGHFDARRTARYCGDYCRIKANRRNARQPLEASAESRAAAVDLAKLVGAMQAGKCTRGQFSRAAVDLITTRFSSVNEALIALGELAWQGINTATPAPDMEREDAR